MYELQDLIFMDNLTDFLSFQRNGQELVSFLPLPGLELICESYW